VPLSFRNSSDGHCVSLIEALEQTLLLLTRRFERMETRIKLLEEELHGGMNLARFSGRRKNDA